MGTLSLEISAATGVGAGVHCSDRQGPKMSQVCAVCPVLPLYMYHVSCMYPDKSRP
jgi:hypothetical protein